MPINVPQGGTTWSNLPAHVTPAQQANYVDWINRYANQYNVPVQILMNMASQESNWRPDLQGPLITRGPQAGTRAQGMMQFMPNTAAIRRQVWNWPDFDPFNPEHAIHGAARELSEIYGRLYGNQANGNWEPVVAGYNWGDNRDRLRNWGPETQNWLRDNNTETSDYWQALVRGVVPPPRDTNWGFPTDTAPPSPSGPFTFQNGQWVPGRDNWWNGDDGREIGPDTGLPVPPLPAGTNWGFPTDWVPPPRDTNWGFPGTGPPVPSELQPTTPPAPLHFSGAELEQRSHNAGYDLPAGVADFVGRVAPELAGGPESFGQGGFPWFTPGRITEDVGEILQHHALMPNNLLFNPQSQTWDVPNERRFPSNTGIWGASQVASQLPSLGEGFNQDYLRHLGYGATQAGFGVPPSGNLFPQPSGYPWGTTGMGNQGWGNISDMSTPQPINYNSWFGGGTNNNNWALANTLDPNVGNLFGGTNEPAQPDFNATFGAFAPGPSTPGPSGVSDYFATMGLPSGGFAPTAGFVNPVPTTIAGPNESFGNVSVANTIAWVPPPVINTWNPIGTPIGGITPLAAGNQTWF